MEKENINNNIVIDWWKNLSNLERVNLIAEYKIELKSGSNPLIYQSYLYKQEHKDEPT